MKPFKLCSLFCVLAISSASAVELKLDEVRYSLGMSGNYVESDNVKARVLSLDVGLFVREEIIHNLKFHVHLLGNFENGTNKSTGLTAEFEPNQNVNLWDGGLTYTPWDFTRFQIGAINQNIYTSPLLVWGTAFAGTVQQVSFGDFYFKAQQAIPNNNILSRRIGGVDEGTPYFFIETAGYAFDDKKLNFKTELSRFAYKDLSSQVALTSQDFGNSVSGIGESARFLYNFKGNNAFSEIGYRFDNDWKVSLNGQYLFNEKAPDGRNTGYLGEAGLGKGTFLFKAGLFRNESDTAPSFYNARYLGHNNMKGSIFSVIGQSNDYLVRITVVQGEVIEKSLRQSNNSIINFMLVRYYDL